MISRTLIYGASFSCGDNVIIEKDVIVGDNVKLGHNVTLKSGTRILDNVILGDYVKTTGLCIIGNHVSVRTGACISKAVIVNDKAFIGPGVMTNHTKNVMHMRGMREYQMITEIGYGAVIGSMASLLAGVKIGDNVVVGAGANVCCHLLEPGIYVGNPARWVKPLDDGYALEGHTRHLFTEDMLRKYLPGWVGFLEEFKI